MPVCRKWFAADGPVTTKWWLTLNQSSLGITRDLFLLYSVSLFDSGESAIEAEFNPFIQELEELELPYTYETNDEPGYHDQSTIDTPPYFVGKLCDKSSDLSIDRYNYEKSSASFGRCNA
ncbi:hypothetical protein PDIDSM_190 [Penicillium digitatum]|nr:hypothetical protein PDIDSM_190 [Penicillium digitatum]